MIFKIGTRVRMTLDALENYGSKYAEREFTISHVATKYMPAKEFYRKSMPDGYHPGYDESANGRPLYDLEELEFSLYYWEVNYVAV